jgi:LemA protein
MPIWLLFVGALIILGGFLLGTYNALVKSRNMTDESWSGVDVQLKRRRDLIPNLVTTVQGYASHEAETLQMLTEARVAADAAAVAGSSNAALAENRVTVGLRGLFVVTEKYPDLKADKNFLRLQLTLVDIENNVAGARSIYNENARLYNDRVQSFPANLFAGTLGFRPRPYVEAAAPERVPARVGF